MTLVQPGEDTLQAALTAASPGDELVLADGTYTGNGGNAGSTDNVLVINKDITIRAQNAGQAVLDGQGTRRVLYVGSGTVSLEGLNFTNGNVAAVCSCGTYALIRDSTVTQRSLACTHMCKSVTTPSPRWDAR